MNLKVLGSSSKGNCYILETPTDKLILDAGVSFKAIQHGLGYRIDNVIGCLVTHEHGDHSKAVKPMLEASIDVYMTKGTAAAIGAEHHRLAIITSEKQFSLGDFAILPFKTEHDAAEPVGYLIQYKPTGEKILWATDTYYVRYRFTGLNYLIIECNYCTDILAYNVEEGIVPEFLMRRLQRSHFSLDNLKIFLRANDLKTIRQIVLIHLSGDNSNGTRMQSEIEDLTRKPVDIARPGKKIRLEMCPF